MELSIGAKDSFWIDSRVKLTKEETQRTIMSTYKMTKRPLWTSLLVMLHLFAVLMPATARPVSAQVTSCGETSAQAASAPTITVASADQDVTIPKEKVDLAVYTANWGYKL